MGRFSGILLVVVALAYTACGGAPLAGDVGQRIRDCLRQDDFRNGLALFGAVSGKLDRREIDIESAPQRKLLFSLRIKPDAAYAAAWSLRDADEIENLAYLRRLVKKRAPASLAPSERARRIFETVVWANVCAVDAQKTNWLPADRMKLGQIPPSEQAETFVALCRQAGLDAVVVELSDQKSTVRPLAAVSIDRRFVLFDPYTGLSPDDRSIPNVELPAMPGLDEYVRVLREIDPKNNVEASHFRTARLTVPALAVEILPRARVLERFMHGAETFPKISFWLEDDGVRYAAGIWRKTDYDFSNIVLPYGQKKGLSLNLSGNVLARSYSYDADATYQARQRHPLLRPDVAEARTAFLYGEIPAALKLWKVLAGDENDEVARFAQFHLAAAAFFTNDDTASALNEMAVYANTYSAHPSAALLTLARASLMLRGKSAETVATTRSALEKIDDFHLPRARNFLRLLPRRR